jgi:hypothetical protein
VGVRKKDLKIEFNTRTTAAALTGLIILSAAYIAAVEMSAPRDTLRINPGWTGTLSNATISDSSIGKIVLSLSAGGTNLTITANSTSAQRNTFYGANLEVTPHVNSSQLPFFDIWIKSNSIYVAGTVSVELDSGSSMIIIQKTYNTNEWHQEIVLLDPFSIPPQNLVVKIMLGFKTLNSPSSAWVPTVEYSHPSFGNSSIKPQGF